MMEKIYIRQATNSGYIECRMGGCADLSYPSSQTRRGRVIDGGFVCPTLTAEHTEVHRIDKEDDMWRIRKLTPKECWRLMDLSGDNDENYLRAEEVNSNTQLYKQAGNSIIVNVLVAILGQMFEGKEEVYKDVKSPNR